MKNFCAFFCLAITYLPSLSQVGNLDPTFGLNGIEKIKFIAKGDLISQKGESFAVEVTTGYNAAVRVVKYLNNGNIDITYGNFGFTALVDMKYVSAAIQEDGKIIVAGTLAFPLYVHDQTKVVRFKTDGSIDYTFITPELGTVYNFPTKTTTSNNEVYVLGYAASVASGFNFDWVYSNQKTTSVSPVRTNSSLSRARANFTDFSKSKTVAVNGNKMIVAGLELFESQNFPYQTSFGYYLSKYTNGILDSSFGGNGRVIETLPAKSYEHMILSQNGKIIIASAALNTNTGKQDFRVTRLNEDGSPDQTFNGTGSQMTSFKSDVAVNAIILNGDKIIVGGTATNESTGTTSFVLARYKNNGTPDSTFSEDGKQTLGEDAYSYKMEGLKIEGDRLLASGTISSSAGETFKTIAAFLLKENIVLNCLPTKTVSTDKGLCSAVVTGIDPIATWSANSIQTNYTISGATSGSGSGSVSGKTFNKGESIVTYTIATDPAKSCSFKVIVEDKEAPVITSLYVNPKTFWFTNHALKEVEVNYIASDNCGVVKGSLNVSSNEPETGTDAADVDNDWKIIDDHHVQLRQECAPKGNGRIYTIKVIVKDQSGNSNEQEVKVSVPRYIPVVKVEVPQLVVKVFNNPTVDVFTIAVTSDSNEKLSLKVVDIFGRVVETRSGIVPNSTLTLGAQYRKGIYSAELIQQDHRETIKLEKH